MDLSNQNIGEIVLYQPDDSIRLEVRVENETVWLNRQQMAQLFSRDIKTIGKHINNALREELFGFPTVAKFATVQIEGDRMVKRDVEYYDLDMILSVGYRVKSEQGIRFRRWANRVLKEYLLKGFVFNQRIEQIESFAVETRQMVENIAIESHRCVTEIQRKLEFLAQYVEDILSDFNDINEDTRTQLNEIYQALTELAERRKELDRPRNPIGFIQHKK